MRILPRIKVLLIESALVWVLTAPAFAAGAADASFAKNIFARRCTGCHTYGRGAKVGPDLKGVTERRGRAWLLTFIRSSSRMIQARDPVALRLFKSFKRERMPDWSDLSPQQIAAILDYFAAGGPTQKEPEERDATTATAVELESGRRLFVGDESSASRVTACVLCHKIRSSDGFRGGTLGPDLSTAYRRYRDKAITDYLKNPSSSHRTSGPEEAFLAPQQIFNVKAYLASAATKGAAR